MRFQQLKRDPNAVMRKRLVKSKKNWVVISGLSLAGALFLLTAPSYVAKAETTTDVKAQVTAVNTTPSQSATDSLKNSNNLSTSKVAVDGGDKGNGSADTKVSSSDPSKNGVNANAKPSINDTTLNDKSSEKSDANTSDKELVDKKTDQVNDSGSDSEKGSTSEEPTEKSWLSLFPSIGDKNKNQQKPQESKGTKPNQKPDASNTDKEDQNSKIPVPSDAHDINESIHETGDSVIVNADNSGNKDKTEKTNSGQGWEVANNGKTLNIVGKLDEGTGFDHERWGGNTQTITTININVALPITAPKDSSYLFANMTNLKKINYIEKLNTENIDNAEGMFKNDSSLEALDLSAHTMTIAHNISHMFENDRNLKSITFKSTAFSQIRDASYAFANDTSLEGLLVSGSNLSATNSWKAKYATDLRGMFKNDSQLKQLNLFNWDFEKADTGNSLDGEGMFDGTNLYSIVLNDNLKFSPHTALTSEKGKTWISDKHRDGSDKKIAFSGIPTFDKDGNIFNGIGSLYVVNKRADESDKITDPITYKANNFLKDGQSVNNLVTITTAQGDMVIVVPSYIGDNGEVNIPDDFTSNGIKYKKVSSNPQKGQASSDETQSSTDKEVTYVIKSSKDNPVTSLGTEKPNESTNQPNLGKPVEPAKQPDLAKPTEPAKQPDLARPTEPAKRPDSAKPTEPAKQPKPAKPTEPAKQPDSAKPTEPAKQPDSAKPTEPAKQPDSAKPTEPTKQPDLAKPTEPAKQPKPAKPTEPAKQPDSAKPTEPTKQPDSAKPTEPAKRPDSAKPTEPAKRPDSAKPAEPTKQPDSAKPTEPAKQPDSAKPAEQAKQPDSAKPTEPAKRPDSAKPTEPAKRPDSAKLAEPTKQPDSAKPTEPTKQPDSAKPTEPAKRPDSAKPTEPAKRPDSAKPAEPTKQPDSAKPAEQAKQPKPEKPVELPNQPDSAKPTETTKQPKPAKPIELPNQPDSAKPAEQAKQPKPAKPAEPAKQPDSAKPVESTDQPKPEASSKPAKPEAPVKPDNQDNLELIVRPNKPAGTSKPVVPVSPEEPSDSKTSESDKKPELTKAPTVLVPDKIITSGKIQTGKAIATYSDRPAVAVYQLSSKNEIVKIADMVLDPTTEKYSESIVTIDGTNYYQIDKNAYVRTEDAYVYTPVDLVMKTSVDKYINIYTAEGKLIRNEKLNGIDLKINALVYINGEKYYRISNNEFVKASDIDVNI